MENNLIEYAGCDGWATMYQSEWKISKYPITWYEALSRVLSMT